ncbi:MAG: fasciclin domain-containing protein [Pirellulales bacterium]|nr:fasciclin domain-containing protein [Pirellulales bacterium]
MSKSLTLVAVAVVAGLSISSQAMAQKCHQRQSAMYRISHPAAQPRADEKNIVEIAAGAEDFSTLVAAVKAAGLVETLTGDGPFTVFAPTNDAFKKLPAGTVESLLKPENKDKLIAILKYHVVPGKVMAADVVKLSEAETAQGQKVKIMTKDGKVMIDSATVMKTDIAASNGVIHVIDSVILPKD